MKLPENLFQSFIGSMFVDGRKSFMSARSFGIGSGDLLDTEAASVFDHCLWFCENFSEGFPDEMSVFGETDIELPSPPESGQPFEYWIEKIQEYRMYLQIRLKHGEIGDALNAGAPDVARDLFVQGSIDLRESGLLGSHAASVFELGDKVWERYQLVKSGVRGVPYPWPSINRETLGMWPGELILFVARTSVGKTWLMSYLALHAWKNKKRVLFATTEISQQTIAARFLSMHLRAPYDLLRKGHLPFLAEDRLKNVTAEMLGDDGMQVIGGEFDFKLPSLDAAIAEARPDLVILDGAYLVEGEGKTRTDKMASVYNSLKRMANRNKVPLVLTTQFNRAAKNQEAATIDLANSALSDVGGWNADMAFGLYRTQEMLDGNLLGVKNLKARETVCPDIQIAFDFDSMDFCELVEGEANGDAAEPTEEDAPDEGWVF